MNKKAKNILVHLHIYYQEMWPELKNCLQNIQGKYNLFVTMSVENTNLQKDILAFKEDSKIEIVENRGFDVGPFIEVINSVNLDDYKYVIKLHTKRDLEEATYFDNHSYNNAEWRNLLLTFISCKNNLNASIRKIKLEPRTGMISHHQLIISNKDAIYTKENIKRLKMLLNKHNIGEDFSFVAGTMFIAKATLLKPLQDLKLSINDFEAPIKGITDGQLAHVIERYIGAIIYSQGYKIKDATTKPFVRFVAKLKKYTKYFYRVKITKSNKKLIKICKIPVYSRKIDEKQ